MTAPPDIASARDRTRRPQRGPAGDARPNFDAPDPRTSGGQPAEDVEDRPNVSTVKPEDYPDKASGADVT